MDEASRNGEPRGRLDKALGSGDRDEAARPLDQSRGVGLAVLATFFFSTSAVLVRLAEGLAPLEVASYRLLLGAGFVALFALIGRTGLSPFRPGPAAVSRTSQLLAVVAAGLVAALHFAFYIGSLYRTSIAHALVLVNMSPLLAMPLAWAFLKERFDLKRLPGVLAVVFGLAVMVGLDSSAQPGGLGGDLMALLAALAYAAYSLIGRSQRTRSGLLPYMFWVYLVAGLALLPLALWQRAFTLAPGLGLSGLASAGPVLWKGLVAVILLALLPTAGGHTIYNAALRRADTVTVNLVATQEVTGGVILGLLLLGEVPSLETIAGGIIALGGLYLVLRRD